MTHSAVADSQPRFGAGARPDRIALDVAHLSKTFPGTTALDDVSFQVRAGHIHGLLGGNGCGKSTLIKILAGVYQADPGGRLTLDGLETSADQTTPDLARACGLRFVHQNASTFTDMTVAENVAIGGQFPTRAGRIRWKQLRRRTQELMDTFEIAARPDDRLSDLRAADQTMIAIARALQDVDESGEEALSVLVLDEPTASLPEHEVNVLLEALRGYAARGQTILYVSHRIDEVLSITDSVTVLRDGHHVVTRPTAGLLEAELIEHIVGRSLEQVYAASPPTESSNCLLTVRDLSVGPLRNVSFDVRTGEVLGIAGLLGSGRTELLHTIFGTETPLSGSISLEGEELRARSPRKAMRRGVALVPEDRVAEAAFLDMTVRQNLSMAEVARYTRRGLLDHGQERSHARQHIERFSIRTPSPEALFSSLSGGNQQKVVLARWLQRNPKLLLLDEPTQGVDVGARAEVYEAVRAAVREGMSAILVTSDFEELAFAADRAIVLSNGRICAEVAGEELTRQRLTELVFSAHDKGTQT